MGRPAADADDGEDPDDKDQKNETLHQRDLICFHYVIMKLEDRAGAMGCSPHAKFILVVRSRHGCFYRQ